MAALMNSTIVRVATTFQNKAGLNASLADAARSWLLTNTGSDRACFSTSAALRGAAVARMGFESETLDMRSLPKMLLTGPSRNRIRGVLSSY